VVDKDNEKALGRRVQALTLQLSAMTEKCHKLTLDLELTRTRHEHLVEKHASLERAHDVSARQLEQATASKEQLNVLLTDKLNELNRLNLERDVSSRSYASDHAELTALGFQNEKLIVQLEEREHNFLSLKDQYDKLVERSEKNGETNTKWKRECDVVERQLSEKVTHLTQVETDRDRLVKKVRSLEKQVTNSVKIRTTLQEKIVEFEVLTKKENAAAGELKECRCENKNLRDTVNALKKTLECKEGNLGMELNQMSEKLKCMSQSFVDISVKCLF